MPHGDTVSKILRGDDLDYFGHLLTRRGAPQQSEFEPYQQATRELCVVIMGCQ